MSDRVEIEWDIVNLCDEKAIKGLLKYRDQFTSRFDIGSVCVYADLDLLINDCNFNDKQRKLLELYQAGYIEEDISIILGGITQQGVSKNINSCIKKIINQSKQNWLYEFIYWDKIKTSEKWKLCKKCNKFKQESQFGMDGRNKDGFKSYCHKCTK